VTSTQGFDFEEGDRVLIRVREHGTRGNIVAKFEAECSIIREMRGPASPQARFNLDWGAMNSVTLRPTEAEFEVL
jgi:hypothetical protein